MSWKERVAAAIATLNERSGSSLQTIKKALGVDDQTQWRFINAALSTKTPPPPEEVVDNNPTPLRVITKRKVLIILYTVKLF